MNISTDLMGGSIAKITLELFPSDYRDELDGKLQKYRREISMPGFRKGKVPMAVVRKQFGHEVLTEVVDSVINRAVNEHLESENLKPIDALPPLVTGPDKGFDPDADSHTYVFEFALFPEFPLDLDAELAKVPFYKIVMTEADVDNEIEEYRHNYGRSVDKDGPSEKGDALDGVFSNKEHGIESDTQIDIADTVFADPEILQRFVGKKPGDVVRSLPTKKMLVDGLRWTHYLNITDEQEEILESDGTKMDFTVDKVCITELAELNPDFFNQIFEGEDITDLAKFRERVKTSMEEEEEDLPSLEKRRFLDDALEHLEKNVPFELPGEHLRRVYEREKENKEIRGSYSSFEGRIRENIIFSKIAAEYGLQPSNEEVLDHMLDWASKRAAIQGKELSEKEATATIRRVFSNQQELNDVLTDLEMEKVLELIRDKSTAQDPREISFTDFWKGYEPW